MGVAAMIDVEQLLATMHAERLADIGRRALELQPIPHARLGEELLREAEFVNDVEGRRADRLARR